MRLEFPITVERTRKEKKLAGKMVLEPFIAS
jgi:hypothetical protein